jgi:hypothetical protein
MVVIFFNPQLLVGTCPLLDCTFLRGECLVRTTCSHVEHLIVNVCDFCCQMRVSPYNVASKFL